MRQDARIRSHGTSVGRDPEARLRPVPAGHPRPGADDPQRPGAPAYKLAEFCTLSTPCVLCALSETVGPLPEGCAGLCQHAQGQPAQMGKPADAVLVTYLAAALDQLPYLVCGSLYFWLP